ncbi:MAG: Fur family transcriptional regulator [Cyanobacteria bacterium P01_F01_bin.33]
MSLPSETIVGVLKAKGLRVTPQRFSVYELLLARDDHPTAEQMLTELNRDRPVLSQATVYSALQALREAGLVREVLLEEGVSRYDANVERHHHFHCRECGAIADITWDTFSCVDLNRLPAGLHGEEYEITVQGTCDRCRAE